MNLYKLGDIFRTTSGGTPSRKNLSYYDGNIPWVKSGELESNIILDTEEKISEEALKSSSAKVFPKGTLLIALYGATIGKLAKLGIDAATNQAVCGIFENEEQNLQYLYWFLRFKRRDLINAGIGGAQPNISQTILKNLDVPLPSKPIQQAIVSKIEELFSKIDKGIEQLKTARQQLKTYRQAVLKLAFEGKLTEDWRKKNRSRVRDLSSPHTNLMVAGEEVVYEKKSDLPEGWKRVLIIELVEKNKHALKAGPFGSSLKKEFYVATGYKIYGQEQVINDDAFYGNYYINEEKYQELNSCKIKPFDILISLVGTVGKVLVLPNNCEQGIINPRLIKISLDINVYLPEFFKYYFESSFVKSFYGSETKGTTMDVLNLGIIKTIPFPLCSTEEQEFIVQEIESRFSVADKMEESISQSLQQAEVLRQSILKKAFEGKLVQMETEPFMKVVVKQVPVERKILAGKIIHLLHDAPHFRLTKFQKVLFVAENFAEVEYDTNYLQETAGPYDRDFTLAFKKEMEEKDWFHTETRRDGTRFLFGDKVGSLIVDYPKHFKAKREQIAFVLQLLRDSDTHEAELIATLYAVWNNRLIQNKLVDITLLTEDFFKWSAKKSEVFLEQEIRERYEWMKKVGLMPRGFGKVV